MARRIDYTGRQFGRLTALNAVSPRNGATRWLFRCNCGNAKEINMASVVKGDVRSCGCLHLERCASGLNRRRHGDARQGNVTRLHNIWRGMVKRCAPTGAYGLRGITLCEEWATYEPFKAWATANGYEAALTIERKDNAAGYSPGNCCWATRKEQARNRRTSRIITLDGVSKTLAEWCEQKGIRRESVRTRLKCGWSETEALTTPIGNRRPSR